MVGHRRGVKDAFAAALPEKRVFIQTTRGTRSLRMTTGIQALAAVVLLALAGWLAVATSHYAVDMIAADGEAGGNLVLHEAYQARLNALTAERDARAAEALSAQSRFRTAMDQISRQQIALLSSVADRRDLATTLDLMRSRLDRVVDQRDAFAAANERVSADLAAAPVMDGSADADLATTLEAVTDALTDAVATRDAAAVDRNTLAADLAATELELRLATRRQDEMIDQLRQVVAASSGAIEKALRKADLDVDSVLATVRPNYSGQGGPLVPIGVSSRSYPGDAAAASRFDELMIDVDRMNLLRIALGKVPYAMPVTAAHRFTSAFGYRRDPKGGGRRMHSGVDLAGPLGTPIYAGGDGVVVSAKNEGGYGNTVRIQHGFGFQSVYAHQSRLRVKPGQRVSRGDHIGDMGRSGRTTGVHLHYEVHLNGRPVNPMTYVEAAKDVF